MTLPLNDPRALINSPDEILAEGATRTLLYRLGLYRGKAACGWTEQQLNYLFEITTGETLFDMLFELIDKEIEKTNYEPK